MSERRTAFDVNGQPCGFISEDGRYFEHLTRYSVRLFRAAGVPYAISDRDFSALSIDEARNVIAHLQRYIAAGDAAVEWTKELVDATQNHPAITRKTTPKSAAGYVYLVQSPSGAYKIGLTKTPNNRAQTFGVQLPFEVEFVAVIKTDDMHALESELHAQFADKRINGEWFALDSEDVKYIKGLAK